MNYPNVYRPKVWLSSLPVVVVVSAAAMILIQSVAIVIVGVFIVAVWTIRSLVAWYMTFSIDGEFLTQKTLPVATTIDFRKHVSCRYFPLRGDGKTLDVAVFQVEGTGIENGKTSRIFLPRYGWTREDRRNLYTRINKLLEGNDAQIDDSTLARLHAAATK